MWRSSEWRLEALCALGVIASLSGIACSPAPPGPGAPPRSRSVPKVAPAPAYSGGVELLEGIKSITVVDFGGGESACRRMLDVTRTALPLIEREAGFAYPYGSTVRIEVFDDPRRTGNYIGQNGGTEVRIQGHADANELIHELAHYWIDGRFVHDYYHRDRWLTEGLAQWLVTRTMLRDPSLGDPFTAHEDQRRIVRGNHLIAPLWDWQPPFPVEPSTLDEVRAFYAKAYVFVYLVAASAGSDQIREVNAEIARSGVPTSGEDYMRRLIEREPLLTEAAQGWLAGGKRNPDFTLARLADRDQDGLDAVTEKSLGTSELDGDTDGDGVGDAHEWILFRTDPLAADHDRRAALRQRVDRVDPVGDLENGAGRACDLARVVMEVDARTLQVTFMLVPQGPRDAWEPDRRYSLAIDRNDDETFDHVISVDAYRNVYLIRLGADGAWEDEERCDLALVRMADQEVHVSFPLALLGVTGEVEVYPFTSIQDPLGNRVFADQNRWSRLKLTRTGSR